MHDVLMCAFQASRMWLGIICIPQVSIDGYLDFGYPKYETHALHVCQKAPMVLGFLIQLSS